jgi:hypothetical protein
MTDRELKRLSRMELLGLLIEQMKENERLQERIDTLEKQLEERRIIIDESGSLAEASLRLSGIFEAADKAAREYLYNIKHSSTQKYNKEDN